MPEYNMKDNKTKKLVKKAGLCFTVLMVLLTFFSKTIDNLMLPLVDYTYAVAGTLETRLDVKGSVHKPGLQAITSKGNWKTIEIYVEEGKNVFEGSPLALVDPGEGVIELNRKELELKSLENACKQLIEEFSNIEYPKLKADTGKAIRKVKESEEYVLQVKELYGSGSETLKALREGEANVESAKSEYEAAARDLEQNIRNYNRSLEQKQAEIKLVKLELENISGKVPPEGKILCKKAGYIESVFIQKGYELSQGQKLFEITSGDQEPVTVEWDLELETAESFNIRDSVRILIPGKENLVIDGKIVEKESDKKKERVKFNALLDLSPLKSQITTGSDGNKTYHPLLLEGQTVRITALKRSDKYSRIVPNKSLVKEAGQNYIYIIREQTGLLGKETYAEKTPVNIIDSDIDSSAIKAAGINEEDRLVINSSVLLSDGSRVKLMKR